MFLASNSRGPNDTDVIAANSLSIHLPLGIRECGAVRTLCGYDESVLQSDLFP